MMGQQNKTNQKTTLFFNDHLALCLKRQVSPFQDKKDGKALKADGIVYAKA